MTTQNRSKKEAGADNSFPKRINLEIVLLRERGDGAAYRATCTDAKTGVVIGRRLLPETAGCMTLINVVEMMGGAYRCASIGVDIEMEQLARRNRRISGRLRRLRRSNCAPAVSADLLSDIAP
jgi:hypothetical protein